MVIAVHPSEMLIITFFFGNNTRDEFKKYSQHLKAFEIFILINEGSVRDLKWIKILKSPF